MEMASEQRKVVLHFLKGCDLFACLMTGCRKSLIYQIAVVVAEELSSFSCGICDQNFTGFCQLWKHHMLDRTPISCPPSLIFSSLAMRDLYEQMLVHV